MLVEQCIGLSLTITLLLWAIWLKTRTSYGSRTVNKLTMFPFKVAIAALATRAIMIVAKIFLVAYQICVSQTCILNSDYAAGFSKFNALNLSFNLIDWLEISIYLVFVISLYAE